MSINLIPSNLQNTIQQGYLERKFQDALRARIGFRAIADREPFMARVGETITKTRAGLRPAMTSVLTSAAATDLDSGMTATDFADEQYTLTLQAYGDMAKNNLVTERVNIESLFLKNTFNLGEQAARSIDMLARNALFNAHLSGNTRILSATGNAIVVDSVNGFSAGSVFTINGNAYEVSSVTANANAVSSTFGGTVGTIVVSGSLASGDNVAASPVQFANAASYYSTTSTLSAQAILNEKAILEANNVPTVDGSGLYHLYIDPRQAAGLYSDTMFQSFLRGRSESPEYREGVIAELLGVKLIMTNLNPYTPLAPAKYNAILVGQGALVEGVFTGNGYEEAMGIDNPMITLVDGVAHVVREPLDALKQWITQSWVYYGGFTVPTDITTTTAQIPSATNAAYKRGMVLASN